MLGYRRVGGCAVVSRETGAVERLGGGGRALGGEGVGGKTVEEKKREGGEEGLERMGARQE